MSTIIDRTLKYTYGLHGTRNWVNGDPVNRRIKVDGNVDQIGIFSPFVTRGIRVGVDQEFTQICKPLKPNQMRMSFPIYITTELSTEYCDEPGMKLLGELSIDLPDVHLGLNRDVEKWKLLLKQKIYKMEDLIILGSI